MKLSLFSMPTSFCEINYYQESVRDVGYTDSFTGIGSQGEDQVKNLSGVGAGTHIRHAKQIFGRNFRLFGDFSGISGFNRDK